MPPAGISAYMSINRIDKTLRDQSPGLWPFLPVGYPSLEATADMLRAFAGLPIRGVELGLPFSDPIADGPVIQEAFTWSLEHGTRLSAIFDMIASVRGEVPYPILAMGSASIIYRIGVDSFVARARTAGIDGLIVPDISLEEALILAGAVDQAGLRLSMLIAPTTPADRQARIAKLASGFLYYVSVQGITGQRKSLPADLMDHVAQVRSATGLPVIVGFGISTPSHVADVCGFADGAIVGSAIVSRITAQLSEGRSESEIVRSAADFVAELAQGAAGSPAKA